MTPPIESPIELHRAERASLRSRGLLAIPGALAPSAVASLRDVVDRAYAEEIAAGRIGDGEAMHLLGGIARDEAFLELLDHPAVLPEICAELGWNIYVYHSHVDVTPPRGKSAPRTVWGWHQDGGRQNLELDGDPRPRLSLKVAYWLSDLSAPGRGNMLVIPASHERNTLRRPPSSEEEVSPPAGAEPVLARAGDALIFDRRLWHSRSDNLSAFTRRVIFLAYTYRWVRPRDEVVIDFGAPSLGRLSPIRRQLLGLDADPHSHWGISGGGAPLRAELARRRALDPP